MSQDNNRNYYSGVPQPPNSNNMWYTDPYLDPSAMSDISMPYMNYQRSEMDAMSEFSLPTRTGTDVNSDWARSLPPTFENFDRATPSVASDHAIPGCRFDVENAKRKIPEVIRALSSDDIRVVLQATKAVLTLTRQLPFRFILSTQLLHSLIKVAEKFQALEVLGEVLASVQYLSMSSPQACLLIFQYSGIPLLLNLLSYNNEIIIYFSMVILHNVILSCEHSHPILRKNTHIFISLLRKPHVKFLAITIDCLQLICRGSQEAKKAVFSCNGHEELVSLLFSNKYEKLLWSIVRLVKVLSVEGKSLLIRAGIVQALCKHLEGTSDRYLQNAMSILRNLSDEALKMPGMYNLVGQLARVLENDDPSIMEPTLCALMNLTCTNHENKQTLTREGGINMIMRCLHVNGRIENIVEPAIGLLRVLSSRGPQGDLLRTQLHNTGGIELIRNAFEHVPRNYAILKHLTYLVRNLATSTLSVNELVMYGVGNKVLEGMNKVFNALSQGVTTIPEQNVNLEVLLENCIEILQYLAREPMGRDIILSSNCLHVFIQILFSGPSDDMMLVTCGLLFELVVEPSTVEYLRHFDVVNILSKMLENRDDPIYTFITTIIMKINGQC